MMQVFLLVALIVSCQVLAVLRETFPENDNPDNIGISEKTKNKYRAHLLVASENSPFSRREGLLFVDPEDVTFSHRNDMLQVDLYADEKGRKVMICDNIILLFEYGTLDYSGYRDWQLPYLLNQSRVCIVELKTDRTDKQELYTEQSGSVLHLIRLLHQGTMYTYEWFSKSGIAVPDSQNMALGRLPESAYQSLDISGCNDSEYLRYLPSILMMDGDMLITNKLLTIEDFIARVKTGLTRGFYLPSWSINHPIEFDNVHFVIGVDGTTHPAYPVNAGVMWVRPSPPVIKLLALSILIAGNSGYYWAGIQGGIAYIIERLGTRLVELMNLLHSPSAMPDDKLMLSFSFENISVVSQLALPENATAPYVNLLKQLPEKDDHNAYGVVVPGNWLNSWGCTFTSGKYLWKLGDWMTHFYACSHWVIENGTCLNPEKCTLPALKVMAEYPQLISTPPNLNWTKILLEGIPVNERIVEPQLDLHTAPEIHTDFH